MTRTRRLAIACSAAAALLALLLAPAAGAAGSSVGRLLAPARACPHQAQVKARRALQLRAMRCLTNYARTHAQLESLSGSKPLTRAAGRKAADILRCDEFSHEACGREFTYRPKHFGYIDGHRGAHVWVQEFGSHEC